MTFLTTLTSKRDNCSLTTIPESLSPVKGPPLIPLFSQFETSKFSNGDSISDSIAKSSPGKSLKYSSFSPLPVLSNSSALSNPFSFAVSSDSSHTSGVTASCQFGRNNTESQNLSNKAQSSDLSLNFSTLSMSSDSAPVFSSQPTYSEHHFSSKSNATISNSKPVIINSQAMSTSPFSNSAAQVLREMNERAQSM